jgi:hypothetical protein
MNPFPDPQLVTKLIRVDPLAPLLRGGTKGCVPHEALCRRDDGPDQYRAHRPQYPHDPYDEPLASQVVLETVEAFLAFVEVLLLSEESWLSEESDRSNVRSIIERHFPNVDTELLKGGRKNGFAIGQALRRQDVSTSFLELALYHRSVRRALDDDAFRPFHDMVRGVYQMNKLGRAATPVRPPSSSARDEEGRDTAALSDAAIPNPGLRPGQLGLSLPPPARRTERPRSCQLMMNYTTYLFSIHI